MIARVVAGRTTVTVSGRGRAAGAYRLTVTVVNAAGAVSPPLRSGLRITR